MSQTFPIPGDTFEGRYRIQSVLGAGGFARVYLAEQLNLDRRVAIKVLKPTGESSETWIARFEREAKVISKFKNANTVMMYDYGRTDDDLTYMVLEYVEGERAPRRPVGTRKVFSVPNRGCPSPDTRKASAKPTRLE